MHTDGHNCTPMRPGHAVSKLGSFGMGIFGNSRAGLNEIGFVWQKCSFHSEAPRVRKCSSAFVGENLGGGRLRRVLQLDLVYHLGDRVKGRSVEIFLTVEGFY